MDQQHPNGTTPTPSARPLRILYVAPVWRGSTSQHRMEVLRELGHDVIPLDITPYQGRSQLAKAISYRLSAGPGVWRLNRDVVRIAGESRPEVIWVDKGMLIWPETVRRARKAGGDIPVVHYNPDDPFGGYRTGWRLFLRCIPEYDLHFVPRAVNVQEYRDRGAKRVERYWFSYDRDVHRPVEVSADDRARLGGPIGFVGNHEPERAASMRRLAGRGLPIRVWGTEWTAAHAVPNLTVERRAVLGDDYAKAVCAFDINLGFLRKRNRDLHTQRTFEIPAAGAFMLAERTDEHRALFEEGKEAEFFGSDDELIEKAKYYLDHPAERLRIAAAGRRRCLSSGYSNHDRVAAMIRAVREQLL